MKPQRPRPRFIRFPQSLRGQLIASIWLGMAAVLVPINIYNISLETNSAISAEQHRLRDQGLSVYNAAAEWTQGIDNLLQVLAFTPSIRRLDAVETGTIFDQLLTLFPKRTWSLWEKSGDLVVRTKSTVTTSQQWAIGRAHFQKALSGYPAYGIYANCASGHPCYVSSTPVYPQGSNAGSSAPSKTIGVLSISIDLKDTAFDSRLAETTDHSHDGESPNTDAGNNRSVLSLQINDHTGFEVLMVSRNGHVIFPLSTVNDEMSLKPPAEILSSPWAPIVRLGMQPPASSEKLQQITADGHGYFVFTKALSPQWTILAVSDKNSSISGVYRQIAISIARQIAGLSLLTIAIALVCQRATKPIQRAASTVREFSAGNFEARIFSDRNDEIGKLYKDINNTGASLLDMLQERLAHAVTDEQIRTAASIQQQFIVQELPSTNLVEIAADFDPAYEIGADWFDAFRIHGITYVIIADVCDKGIPSAIFMSVFRSLLRYSLLDEARDHLAAGLDRILEIAVTQVNDYMVENHGSSAMFATLFLGAYPYGSGQLSYICAGHERPFIIRSKGIIHELETSGPAVGVFSMAQYNVKNVAYKPGEILFTYTDGLVDARSPDGTPWGAKRLKDVLSDVDPTTCKASDLLSSMLQDVTRHRSSGEQFDDLTILVMKANPQSEQSADHEQVSSSHMTI